MYFQFEVLLSIFAVVIYYLEVSVLKSFCTAGGCERGRIIVVCFYAGVSSTGFS